MATKTKKVERFEQTEVFISAWEAKPSLWNVMSSIYKDRNAKQRGLKNLAENCQMTGKNAFFTYNFLILESFTIWFYFEFFSKKTLTINLLIL